MLYLLIIISVFSFNANATEVHLENYLIEEISNQSGEYSKIYERLRKNNIKFEINVPEHNIVLEVKYYQQYGITSKDFTISVSEEATEIFFDWAKEKGFILTEDRRDHRTLSIYDIDYSLLNNSIVFDFLPISTSRNFGRINGIYDAHNSEDGSNSIFLGANRDASELSKAMTISHELAHWWCDYFRIYDRYYSNEDGTIDVEGPAYEFEEYFRKNYKNK